MTTQPTYNTLDEIQLRKDQLSVSIQDSEKRMATLWRGLVAPQQPASKGELVANLVSNSVTAIDAFLLVRKLMRSYSYLFGRKKKS